MVIDTEHDQRAGRRRRHRRARGTPRRSAAPRRSSSSSSPTPGATPGCWRSSPIRPAGAVGVGAVRAARPRRGRRPGPRRALGRDRRRHERHRDGPRHRPPGRRLRHGALGVDRSASGCATRRRCATPDGEVAGVIDLSTTWDRANPLGLGTIAAFARLIEAELARSNVVAGRRGLDLRVLGRPRATLDGVPRRPQPAPGRARSSPSPSSARRRSTSCTPCCTATGRSAGRRCGRRSPTPATLLGGAIASRPYRLTVPVRVDALEVLDQLRGGDLDRRGRALRRSAAARQRRAAHRRAALPPRRRPAHGPAARRVDGAAAALRRRAPVRRRGARSAPSPSPRRTIPTCRPPSPRWPSPPPTSPCRREPATSRRRTTCR